MKEIPADVRAARLRFIVPAAVFFLTFLAFSNGLSNAYVNWDDLPALVRNPAWRGLDPARLRWMLSTFDLGHYQPLSWLTLGLDYALWGPNPFGIHLTSLLLHCASAVVVYLLGLRLIKDRLGAAAAALIFSLHPLRVESVVWAAQRRDPLSGLFFLWAMLCWLDGRRRAALACAFLSLCSKFVGVTLPAVLLLLDVYPLGRLPSDVRRWGERGSRAVLLEKLPFVLLAAFFLALNFVAQLSVGTLSSLAHVGWGERLRNSAYSFFFYIGKTLWPAGLSPLYSGTVIDVWSLGLGVVACALLAYAARREHRLKPALAAAFLFYAITLFPYLGILKSGKQVAADRYTYVSCLPWALLAGAGLAAAARGRRRPVAVAAAALLTAGLTAGARGQTARWSDSLTLWRHALAVEPFSETPRQIIATALIERNRVGEAILYMEEQLRIFPSDRETRKNLTSLTGKNGLAPEARARIHLDLAREFLERGEKAKADWHFRRASRATERRR